MLSFRMYVESVGRVRWSSSAVYSYALNLGHRVEDLEPILIANCGRASNCFLVYRYARDIIKGRWPEAEEVLLSGRVQRNYMGSRIICLRKYAEDVIKGRWVEAERFLMEDPAQAYFYARDVVGGRFVEAESVIMLGMCCVEIS